VTEIILVRHGETAWNVKEVFRGRIDVGLNDTGLKQAELLGKHLADIKIEAVYSSPLKRSLQTAEEIASHHALEVLIEEGLNDLDFGDWQGLTRTEVREKYEASYNDWLNRPEEVRMPGGESLGDVWDRAMPVINKIVEEDSRTVVLASHRVIHKVLICALLGLDRSHFWNIKLDTCGMTTFTYENGKFILDEHNNTSFLESLRKEKLADF